MDGKKKQQRKEQFRKLATLYEKRAKYHEKISQLDREIREILDS